MKKLILIILPVVLLVACKNTNEKMEIKIDTENPFLTKSTLPYSAPDFTKIRTVHYEPAMMQGLKEQEEAIKNIVENVDEPTFENTIVALEKSGELLDRATTVFYAMSSAHTNDTIQALEEKMAPKLAAQRDAIYLNADLFTKVKALYDKKQDLDLDAESLKLLENYYEDFVIAGANLSTEDKNTLKEYNSQLASLTTKFGKTLLDGNNAGAVTFTDINDLEGLSEDVLASIKDDGADSWTISLQNTTQQPLLQSMKNRDARERLYKAAWMRTDGGEYDTRGILTDIAKIRAKKAELLGFKNYAEWSLQKTMAKTPENINHFFADFIPAAIKKAQAESDDITKMMNSLGDDFALEPWDWNYYSEMVRKEKYDLDEDQIKPYFELYTVLEKGVFYAMTKLYGVTFKPRTDIPVYHEDVRVYEFFEENGEPLGLFYTDYFKRPSKRGGAWMSNFVEQSKLYNNKPVIYNVCNYPKPAEGKPALITYDEVETLFHEFGHALHGFFANQQYPSLSGTNVARDFVEFPSQFNENWALYPEVLKNYAVHYETGEAIPQELIDKIKNSGTFNQGYSITELLAASNLDLQWHTISSDANLSDADAFEKSALSRTGLDGVHAVPPRYRSTYFAHIFSGGYGAGYYSYQWTEMLHHDAYQWFVENGGMTRENGQRLRDMVLSRGNTMDFAEMYRNWRGSDPKVEPMLKARGLK